MKNSIYYLSLLFLCLMACDEITNDDDDLTDDELEDEEEVVAIFPNYGFTSLSEGSEVWNQVSIEFSAENADQLLYTILYINGDSITSVESTENTILWNSKSYEDGPVTIAIGAELENGQKGELTSLDLNVKNTFLTIEAFPNALNGYLRYILISDLEGNLVMDSVILSEGLYKFRRPENFNESLFHVYDIEKILGLSDDIFYTQVYGNYPLEKINLKSYIPDPGSYVGDFAVNYEGNPPINSNGILPLYSGFGYAFYSNDQFWYNTEYTLPILDYSSVGYKNYHFLTYEDEGNIKAIIGKDYLPDDNIYLDFDQALIMEKQLPFNIPSSSSFHTAYIIGYQDDKYFNGNYVDYSSSTLNPTKEALHHTDLTSYFTNYEIYRYYEDINIGKGYFNRKKVSSVPDNFTDVIGDASLINNSLEGFELSATENFELSNTQFIYYGNNYETQLNIFNQLNTGPFNLIRLESEDIPVSFRPIIDQWLNMEHNFTDVVDFSSDELDYKKYLARFSLREVDDRKVFDFDGITLFNSNVNTRTKSTNNWSRTDSPIHPQPIFP